MRDELQIFRRNLNVYMYYYHLNQTTLAHKIDVSPQVVSKWSRGVAMPSMDNINKMLEVFHCTMSQLFEIEQTEQSIRESKTEARLMNYFNKLNSLGKDKLLEFLEDMNPKFFKEEP